MPRRTHRTLVLAVLFLLLVVDSPGGAQPAPGAGRIKALSGTVSLVRGGQERAPTPGSEVFETDVIRTGSDGQVSLTLRDETRLSLGPGTEVRLSSFAFDPAHDRVNLVLRLARGVLSYVSGRIAKLRPGAVRLETPTSVIGVRGTHVLVRVEP